MAKKDKAAAADAEKPKKGKKKLIIMLLPILLLGGGGYYFFLGGSGKKTKAAALPPITVPFGPITTNLSDGHVVQAQMTLSFAAATLPADVALAKSQMTNAAILAFSGWSYTALLPQSGKNQFKTQLISDLNTVLSSQPTKPKVLNIYFTNFIMQ